MKNEAKKRGRPAGTRTKQAPVVVCAKPACPRRGCGATDREVLRLVKVRELSGMRDGQPYNRIAWRRVRCRVCGQVYVLVSYEQWPEMKNGNPVFPSDSGLEEDQIEA